MTKEANQNETAQTEQTKSQKREGKVNAQRKPKRRINDNNEKNIQNKPLRKNVKRRPEIKADTQYDFEFKKGKLKIIPLGGLEEIGKNITVFEYEDEMILVDCGLEFPEDNMLGVDMVIPDVTYLERNVDKLKGLVVTHGHEDHIGSIPYVLKR